MKFNMHVSAVQASVTELKYLSTHEYARKHDESVCCAYMYTHMHVIISKKDLVMKYCVHEMLCADADKFKFYFASEC